MKRAALVTFGCQMNVHDSQRIEELLRGEGYELVDEPEGADLVVLNTCSVREKAEQKLRSEAGRLKNREGLLVIAGCVAQQEGEALLKAIPHADAIIGPDNIAELPALLRDLEGGAPPVARTVFDTEAPQFLSFEPGAGRVGASAYVTTMKGCNERCSFCIVPYTRGPERYRPADDLLREARALCEKGARELVLLGQTVNSYRDPGVPMPADADPDDSQFPALLRRLASEVPGLLRVRYTSPHPRHLTPELLRAHAELAVLAAHVHLPVQSGSDRMLKRMIRRYTRAEYVARITALRAARPGVTLTTDIIVGFPGETREDFDATLSLVREVGFTGLFGFAYSVRPYTPAIKLRDDVPEPEKKARLAELFELSEGQLRDHLSTLVGTRQHVLLEGPSRSGAGQWSGRTNQNEIVHLPEPEGDASLRAAMAPGAMLEVLVERANKHSLAGRVLSVKAPALAADPASSSGATRTAKTVRRVALPVVGA